MLLNRFILPSSLRSIEAAMLIRLLPKWVDTAPNRRGEKLALGTKRISTEAAMKPIPPGQYLREIRPAIRSLALGLLVLVPGRGVAGLVESLPLLAPDVAAYQISSHNKKGLNGDAGWILHEGESMSGRRTPTGNSTTRCASTAAYPVGSAGYFRARFREGPTTRGRDWIFLETAGQGQFVGVVHRLIGGHYCEGDIRFHLDGSRSPAFYGTGTEDYYHQACWPNSDNHRPFHGCVGDVAAEAKAAGVTLKNDGFAHFTDETAD